MSVISLRQREKEGDSSTIGSASNNNCVHVQEKLNPMEKRK